MQLTNDFWHHQLVLPMGNNIVSHTTTSQTKNYMVLTRSMVTTNNNQGDEPRTTTLERQVQTLAAAVECLTKQNHDLEEQLRQKNAGLNTQEKDQEGTSAEKRDQEGPKGSNALSKPKRPDTSRPSATYAALPYIVVEMQMMKERMDFMMNAFRGQISNDLNELVHQTDSPFIASVTSFPLPLKFCMPQVEAYNGLRDSLDHLESFKTLMHLQGMADEIMCRTFPTILKGPTRVWFNRLTPNSISTFKELSA